MENKTDRIEQLSSNRSWLSFIKSATRRRFTRSVIGSYVLYVVSALLSLATSILLARLLGVRGFGDYAYALNWALVLATLATLGMDQLAVRRVSSYASREEWTFINGLLRWSTMRVLAFSFASIGVIFVLWRVLNPSLDVSATDVLLVAAFLYPLLALTSLHQGFIRGLRYILLGQVAETIVRPSLHIILLFYLKVTPPLFRAAHPDQQELFAP